MAFFRKDTETKNEDADEYDFDFSVLWQDEEQSSLLQYLPAVVQIVLLIWILIKISGLK